MHKTALLCVVSFKLTLQQKMKCIFVISRSLRDAACRSSIATWTCARNASKQPCSEVLYQVPVKSKVSIYTCYFQFPSASLIPKVII